MTLPPYSSSNTLGNEEILVHVLGSTSIVKFAKIMSNRLDEKGLSKSRKRETLRFGKFNHDVVYKLAAIDISIDFVVTNPLPGMTYFFRVNARTLVATSVPSEVVQITVPGE